jgi:hypothetical protein
VGAVSAVAQTLHFSARAKPQQIIPPRTSLHAGLSDQSVPNRRLWLVLRHKKQFLRLGSFYGEIGSAPCVYYQTLLELGFAHFRWCLMINQVSRVLAARMYAFLAIDVLILEVHFSIFHRRFVQSLQWIDEQVVYGFSHIR